MKEPTFRLEKQLLDIENFNSQYLRKNLVGLPSFKRKNKVHYVHES